LLVLVVGAGTAPLFATAVRAQRAPEIYAAWQSAFPTSLMPGPLGAWLIRAIVGAADYCYRPIGGVMLVPIAIGVRALVRRGDGALAATLLAPIALAAIAGAARQYPFAGARLMFALPALSVLAVEGLAALVAAVRARAPLAAPAIVAIAVLPPLFIDARDVMRPWRRYPVVDARTWRDVPVVELSPR
jgi:hypothetical protein